MFVAVAAVATACCQLSPWSPLFVQSVVQSAPLAVPSSVSEPMEKPYMWYAKLTSPTHPSTPLKNGEVSVNGPALSLPVASTNM